MAVGSSRVNRGVGVWVPVPEALSVTAVAVLTMPPVAEAKFHPLGWRVTAMGVTAMVFS
jgi:hypothetical protein